MRVRLTWRYCGESGSFAATYSASSYTGCRYSLISLHILLRKTLPEQPRTRFKCADSPIGSVSRPAISE